MERSIKLRDGRYVKGELFGGVVSTSDPEQAMIFIDYTDAFLYVQEHGLEGAIIDYATHWAKVDTDYEEAWYVNAVKWIWSKVWYR